MKNIISENRGSNKDSALYGFCDDDRKLIHLQSTPKLKSTKGQVAEWVKDIFLPRGYPESVSSDYLEYQVWDSLQAYSSNITGALSLHSTLEGLGVGKDSASALAATLTWLLKDGVGMVSSISFAYWKGSELDYHSKQWRLFADVSCDATNFLKLLAPFLPIPILATLCLSSVMLSLVGVAGGATRASLTQHQAKCDNMADVAAKDGSQETLVNLVGLLTSITILPFITSSSFLTWTTFFLCVLMHLFTNYKAMRAIRMNTLNRPRLLHILESWITKASIPDIKSTNKQEPLLLNSAFISNYFIQTLRAEFGCSLAKVLKECPDFSKEVNSYLKKQRLNDQYLLYYGAKSNKIYVLYFADATTADYLLSFLAAYLLAINLHKETKSGKYCAQFLVDSDIENRLIFTCHVKEKAREVFHEFERGLKSKDWVSSPLRLNIGEYRLSFGGNK